MIDESLFTRETFLLENSEPMTVCVGYTYEDNGEQKTSLHEVEWKIVEYHQGKMHIHEDLLWGYEIAISAIKDNNVYVILYDRVAEYGWKKIETFVLNKFHPQHAGLLKSKSGEECVYCVYIKELGGIKRGIIL